MKIDIHTHPPFPALFASSIENLPSSLSRNLERLRKIYRKTFENDNPEDSHSHSDSSRLNSYLAKFAEWIKNSRFDKTVLLAIDAAYDENGTPLPWNPHPPADNRTVAEFAEKHPEFLFGAGIHPYRKDALRELESCVGIGAVLVKWIPSAQNINPADKRCRPFYEAMAALNIPLLAHTGIEHSISGGNRAYNRPATLKQALDAGVTVIAAHCGMNMFLHEPSYFGEWCDMALEHEYFYGDTAALPLVTRVGKINKIIENSALCSKMIYGSDFPTMPSPSWCWQFGYGKIKKFREIRNPLERNAEMIRELGFPNEILTRAEKVIRL